MRASLVVIACLIPLAAGAQIYRWTDASGTVHFSQNPPDSGGYTRVHPADPSSGVTPGSGGASDYLKQGAKAGAVDDQARQAVVQAKAERAERCAKSRERISFLEQQTAHRLFTKGSDGEPSRVTDEQYDKMIGDARKEANEACGGG